MKTLSILLVSGLLLLGCSSPKQTPPPTQKPVQIPVSLVVIANLGVPVASLTQDDLSDIYLCIKKSWDDGTKIVPINRESGSNARAVFLARALKQQQSALKAYWNKMHYKDLKPPLILESDQAVLAFVQKVPGAIGYVSASIELKKVKVLAEIR